MAFAGLGECQAEFAMSVSLSRALTSLTPKSSSLTAKPADIKSPEDKFLEYAKMTPAERMHAAMLAQLGITEDQFKAMDSAAQQKITDKIREMIRQQAENGGDKRAGLVTDMSV
jgi:hypothetical protein